MELQENSIIVSDRLDGIFDVELRNHFTHAYCTAGECEVTDEGEANGEGIRVAKGDCVIIIANQLVTAIRPSEDFRVKVIYIEVGFLEACTPHTSYGVTGGLTMFVNPVMHLDEREQWLCERDFDEVARRLREPHRYFQGDAMMAVTQTMFCDFYEFHARIYGQPQVSALTASVMRRFIDMLERGDYRRSREVGYYADRLCVTPKYLSEVCRKMSGYAARSAPWDASLVEELLDQPLRHHRHRPPVARQEPLADRHCRHVRLHLAEPLHPLRAAESRCLAQRFPLLMMHFRPHDGGRQGVDGLRRAKMTK